MANRYLRAAATGANNGTDWTNAYTNKQTAVNALSRAASDVLYVAAGNYGTADLNLTVATSGSNRLTIKKATVADHGTDTGWSDSFATGQAVFGHVQIESSFWTFDGVTGGGPSAWTSGHGFKVDVSSGNGSGFQLGFSATATNCILSHVEVVGFLDDESSDTNDAFWIGTAADTVISHCYSHNMGRCHFFTNRGTDRVLVQYCCLGTFRSRSDAGGQHAETAAIHSDGVPGGSADDWTFRYCLIAACGEDPDTTFGATGALMNHGNNLQAYGCIFAPAFGGALQAYGNGLIGTWSANNITNFKCYHCTFINTYRVFGLFGTGGDSGDVRNNIFYLVRVGNDGEGYGGGSVTHAQNYYNAIADGPITEATQQTASGNPFVDWPNQNFRLNANTTPGTNLGAGTGSLPPGFSHSWNVDMFGNPRTSLTRGAIEFATTSPPSAPTNLRIAA